jgi:Putative Flp pilus-assembly TadE/G-like
MRRLIRRRDQERGAIALIVAVLVSALVLTGVAALTIDAGGVYAERRVLQNGADAASLALAQICAKDIHDALCDKTNVMAYLEELAGENATPGHLPSIHEVCGSGPDAGPKFGGCAGGTALIDCPVLPTPLPANVNWVQVKTRYSVPSVFAGLDDKPYNGTVQACARAAWGPAGEGQASLPLTFSLCEWDQATAPAYVGGPRLYGSAHETFIALNYEVSPKPPACYTYATGEYKNGHDFPGAFGWTDRNLDCSVDYVNGDWLTGTSSDSNGSGAKECSHDIQIKMGEDVYIPIYDCVDQDYNTSRCTPTNSKANYHIFGLAAFHITAIGGFGVQLDGGNTTPALLKACKAASVGQKCLYGYFTQGLASVGTIGGPGTHDLGVKVVQVAG